jgi:hypothetical protein
VRVPLVSVGVLPHPALAAATPTSPEGDAPASGVKPTAESTSSATPAREPRKDPRFDIE